MNFTQAVIIFSIGFNIVLLVALLVLISMLSVFRDKVKRASELIDKKFAEQDRRLTQINVMLTTLEVLLSFNNAATIQRSPVIPPPLHKKTTLTVIKDDKDPPK